MRIFASSLAAMSLAALSACNSADSAKSDTSQASAEAGTGFTAALGAAPDMATLAGALKSTGLDGIFSGQGGYTVLAPSDGAFAALGEKGKLLSQPEQQAALAAVLRNHVLPGTLSLDDISKAITAAGGKAVKMRTLGASSVSFSKAGSALVVHSDDGPTARLSGTAVTAGNNAALPIDAVLYAD